MPDGLGYPPPGHTRWRSCNSSRICFQVQRTIHPVLEVGGLGVEEGNVSYLCFQVQLATPAGWPSW